MINDIGEVYEKNFSAVDPDRYCSTLEFLHICITCLYYARWRFGEICVRYLSGDIIGVFVFYSCVVDTNKVLFANCNSKLRSYLFPKYLIVCFL